jgi:hypothetical protein
MKIADLRVQEIKQMKLIKVKQMGSDRVDQAKAFREDLSKQELEKMVRNELYEAKFNKRDELNSEIQDKNRQRNYMITKNILKQKFQSFQKSLTKKEDIKIKQQKATERRNAIINKRIEIARGGRQAFP